MVYCTKQARLVQIITENDMKDIDVNNSVKTFRQKRGLSTSTLSRLTKGEFSPSRISNYENGVRALTVDAAIALAPYLGATAAQLLNLADNFFTDVKLGEHQEELLRLLSQVSLRGDGDVKKVIGILRGYLES
jgi:transcriptional regulator with XRE-family HTH domain